MTKSRVDPIEFDTAVGAVLRSHRKRAGLDEADVAQAIGAKVSQVSRYEMGTNKVSVMRLCEFAGAFGILPSALMRDIEARTSPGGNAVREDDSGGG